MIKSFFDIKLYFFNFHQNYYFNDFYGVNYYNFNDFSDYNFNDFNYFNDYNFNDFINDFINDFLYHFHFHFIILDFYMVVYDF